MKLIKNDVHGLMYVNEISDTQKDAGWYYVKEKCVKKEKPVEVKKMKELFKAYAVFKVGGKRALKIFDFEGADNASRKEAAEEYLKGKDPKKYVIRTRVM